MSAFQRPLVGRDISDVAIQPAASPVSVNVLPAPGQPLPGNDLMQIAQGLAAFNPVLQSRLAQTVTEDKALLSAAGSTVDFTGADLGIPKDATPEQRADFLNKRFRELVQESGSPDSANPYFLIAARQNFGRAVALRYRNALHALKDEATDPDGNVDFSAISAKALEEVGAEAVNADVYSAAGFAQVSNEVNAEMSQRFTVERLQRKEYQSLEDAQNALSDVFTLSKQPQFDESSYIAESGQQILEITKSITDPEKKARLVIGAFKTSILSATDEVEAENMLAGAAEYTLGKAPIRENATVYAALARLKDERVSEIAAEAVRAERNFELQVKKGEKKAMELGVYRQVADAVSTGNQDQANAVIEKIMDQAESEKWGSPAVLDALRRSLTSTVVEFANDAKSLSRDRSAKAYTDLFERVDDGEIDDIGVLKDAMRSAYLDPNQQATLIEYFGKSAGVAQSSTAGYIRQNQKDITQRVIMAMAEYDSEVMTVDALGRPAVSTQAQSRAAALETEWREGAFKEVGKFLRGETIDPISKLTYSSIRSQSGQDAANTAISGILDGYYDRRIKEAQGSLRATKAMRESGASRSNLGSDPQTFLREQADLLKVTRASLAQEIEAGTLDPDASTKRVKEVVGHESADLAATAEVLGLPEYASARQVASELGRLFILTEDGRQAVTREKGWLWDTQHTHDRASVLASYARVKQSIVGGLSAAEVIHNRTEEGLPVFGVVLPTQETAVDFAFTMPVFASESEIRDAETVGQVMDALGLPDDSRAAFVSRQATLLRIKGLLAPVAPPLAKPVPKAPARRPEPKRPPI